MKEYDKEVHNHFMHLVQREWEKNKKYHLQFRTTRSEGVRSSQLSALIAVLIKLGILK